MVLKGFFKAIICTALLAGCGPSFAGEYSPDEFLALDPAKAMLSPNRLGPPARFERIRVEARATPRIGATHARAPGARRVQAAKAGRPEAANVRHARAAKPHRVARAKPVVTRTTLVRKHTNPLDAQAFDTRVQVWPCRSGGICNWQR